jgi:4-carboxymuconolactone decarboxylase
MERIAELRYEDMTSEQKAVADRIMSGPRKTLEITHNTWLRSPKFADLNQAVGSFMRYEILEPRLRELVILTTGKHWDCELEWHLHRGPAEQAGLDKPLLDALAAGRRPRFERDEEAAAYDFVTMLLDEHAVDDATYARTLQMLGEQRLVEVIALCGHYVMVAMLLKTFAWPLPDGVEPQLGPR